MQYFQTYRQFSKALQDRHRYSREQREFIDLTGFLKQPKKPNEAGNLLMGMEKILETSFGTGHVDGIALNTNEKADGVLYLGVVYVTEGNNAVGQVCIEYRKPKGVSDLSSKCYLKLPLGDYESQTISALTNIWPNIRAISRAPLKKDSAKTQGLQNEERVDILLVRNMEIVASGYRALEPLNAKFDRKQIYHGTR